MQGMAPVRPFPPGPNTSIESSRPDARTAEVAAKTRWRGRVRVVGGNRRRRCIVRHSRGRHNCAPFHPGLDQGGRSSGELCPGTKARTTGGTQACPSCQLALQNAYQRQACVTRAERRRRGDGERGDEAGGAHPRRRGRQGPHPQEQGGAAQEPAERPAESPARDLSPHASRAGSTRPAALPPPARPRPLSRASGPGCPGG